MNLKFTKRPRPSDIYFRILQLIETVRGMPELPHLDPLESRILEMIAYSCQKKDHLAVKDITGKRELGSPSMLYRHLVSMRVKGWIMLEDTEHARRKQLVLTKAALTHFDKLSRLMPQTIT